MGSQKRNFCCSNQGIGCNSGGPSIGRRLENEVDEVESESEVVVETADDLESDELETADDLDQRRLFGRYNCWTFDFKWNWPVEKQRWCCNRFDIACHWIPVEPVCCQAMTATCLACKAGVSKQRYCRRNPWTDGCSNENEYTPGGEYNCRFGRPSSWTSQKRNFCCSNQGIGCNSGGPSIGRRLANLVGLDSLEEEEDETTATELLNWTY